MNCTETTRKRSDDNSRENNTSSTKTTTITTSTVPIDTTKIEGTVSYGSNKEAQIVNSYHAFLKCSFLQGLLMKHSSERSLEHLKRIV